jgi:hypothetical protein
MDASWSPRRSQGFVTPADVPIMEWEDTQWFGAHRSVVGAVDTVTRETGARVPYGSEMSDVRSEGVRPALGSHTGVR